MGESDKKDYGLEKKVFSILTQALHRDISHQFAYCTTTKSLWDVLVARGEEKCSNKKNPS
ncbi:hypothetical protein Hanom_Chr00s098019g01802311 [Helianthus anomalus]